MSTLTSLAPTVTTPGSTLTLTGTGFLAGAIVLFDTHSQAGQAVGVVLSATQITCIVPELPPDAYEVRVLNVGEAPSNAKAFTLSPVMRTLCTLDDVKALMALGPDGHAYDAQLGICIRMASAEIINFCRCQFTVASFTEQLDGDGSNMLALTHSPIVAVQALAIDGIAIDVSEALVYSAWIKFEAGDEYSVRLRSTGRIFSRGAKNVSITYTAGYPAVPDDLAMACARQAIYIQNTLAKQGVLNENNTTSQASKSFSLDDQLAPAVKSVALRYRRQVVAVA